MLGANPWPAAQRRRATGWLGDGRDVGNYADEDGVDAGRGTETFAELLLTIENERFIIICRMRGRGNLGFHLAAAKF